MKISVKILGLLLLACHCAQFDAQGSPLGFLLLSGGSSAGGAAGAGSADTTAWWNGDYSYRRKITFGTAHSALSIGHTVSFTLDTSGSSNVSLASGDDVRVVYQPASGSAVELDRIGASWNSTTTTIEFRLQSAVSADTDEAADGSYYVYYGNASAGTPGSDEMNVYYFADFFERADGAAGNGWTEWTDGGNTQISSSELKVEATADGAAPQTGVKQNFSLGALPGNFILTFDWNQPTNGESLWAFYMNVGDSATMVNANRHTGVGVGLYNCETEGDCPAPAATTYNIMSSTDDTPDRAALETGVTGSQSYTLTVDTAAQTYTYNRAAGITTAGVAFANAITNLDQIRFGGDSFGDGVASGPLFDNLKIVLNVADDPETAAADEQAVF